MLAKLFCVSPLHRSPKNKGVNRGGRKQGGWIFRNQVDGVDHGEDGGSGTTKIRKSTKENTEREPLGNPRRIVSAGFVFSVLLPSLWFRVREPVPGRG